jgi:DNA helicase-2/ATP-dependent DNA helicase PcrA
MEQPTTHDTMEDEELSEIAGEEERVLGRILKHVATQAIGQLSKVSYDADLLALRDQIAEARLEDVPPLIQEMERLQMVAARRAEVQAGAIDASSPYFGRLVLEEGERKREVLIGRGTYLDPRTGIRIVDWRDAPVSRLYYRYDEGDDYEENFGGKEVLGSVLTRRSLAIAEGVLRRIVAPQGTFLRRRDGWERMGEASSKLRGGSGKADRVEHYHKPGKLGIGRDGDGRADKFLPEIAALIDPRQFELMTAPSAGLVVIQGGAGSGKTTIGLHRIAYLAYNDPQRFRSDKMLILVFNAALARYISRVLPALGVPNVLVQTYHDWSEKLRTTHLPRLPRLYNEETPNVVVRFKKHPAILKWFEEAVGELTTRVERELETVLPDAGDRRLAMAEWKALKKKYLLVRLDALSRWASGDGKESAAPVSLASHHAISRLYDFVRKEWADPWHLFSELLTDHEKMSSAFTRFAPGQFSVEDIHDVHKWCSSRIRHVMDELEARHDAAEAKREERESGAEDESEEDDKERRVGIDGRSDEDEARATLDREDDTLLLKLGLLTRGALRKGGVGAREPLRFEHIFIDEAQDLSPVELSVVLSTATEKRSITLAGDTAQRLLMDNGFTDWRGVLDELGLESVAVEPLKLAYRSTREIIDFAAHVLGPLSKEKGIATRSGAPIELFQFAHSGDGVGFLAEVLRELVRGEPLASVALISRYPEQADIYYRGLANAEVPNLRRSTERDFPFKPGIDVTDVRQIKGLEFDYVVLLEVSEASYPKEDEARHLLHIAATRAAHQLWVTTSGKPSPLLPDEMLSRAF